MISIIIPSYNGEDYIGFCLDSVTRQNYKEIEIIVIDDGSTDNTKKIVEEYQNRDSRIIYYYQENNGLSAARNKGMEMAHGEFLFFLDSDDVIQGELLTFLMNQVIIYDADIASTNLKQVPETFKVDDFLFKRNAKVIRGKNDAFYLQKITNHACGKLFKKSLFNQTRFPKNRYFEDIFTIPTIYEKANVITHSNCDGYLYRINSKAITQSITPKKMYDIYQAYIYNRKKLSIDKRLKEYYLATIAYTFFSYARKNKRINVSDSMKETLARDILMCQMHNIISTNPASVFTVKILLLKTLIGIKYR